MATLRSFYDDLISNLKDQAQAFKARGDFFPTDYKKLTFPKFKQAVKDTSKIVQQNIQPTVREFQSVVVPRVETATRQVRDVFKEGIPAVGRLQSQTGAGRLQSLLQSKLTPDLVQTQEYKAITTPRPGDIEKATNLAVTSYGLINPAQAVKIGGIGALLNVGVQGVGNKIQGHPFYEGAEEAALEGFDYGVKQAGTHLFSNQIVNQFAGKIPILQKLTDKSIRTTLPIANQTLGQWFNSVKKTGIKKLVRAVMVETPVEALTWGATNRQEEESLIESVQREAVENLIYNVGFASTSTAVDALSPLVRKSITDAWSRYQAMTPLERQAGKIEPSEFLKSLGLAPPPKPGVTLSPDRGLGKDLLRSGFTAEEIRRMTPPQAHKALAVGRAEQKIQRTKELREADRLFDSDIRDFDKSTPAEKRVNALDWFRSPDRILKKVGLEKEGKALRAGWDRYLLELPKEIEKVTEWKKRVPSDEANERIFNWLDGKGGDLKGEELVVAKEIRQYLDVWAKKLGLTEDQKVSEYITHLFSNEIVQKDFPDDLAKLIDEEVAGSVYNPFLQKRVNVPGFEKDTFKALDVYVKRATRKVNMDPALELIKSNAIDLDQASYKYVVNLTASINMRPAAIDVAIDNAVKASPIGYKLGDRPTTSVTRSLRKAVYRGALGLNVKSALKNLTQGSNTYAKLGEKYTAIGYFDLLRKGWNTDEIKKSGVLSDSFIQDRSLSATKKFWNIADKGLWFFFDRAERINRVSAYYGAKKQGMDKGMEEFDAIKHAQKVVRDTQFKFSAIDTPQVLRSDLAKTLLQFQSYNIKQIEFLGEMIKNKEIAGLIRYSAAQLAILATIGDLMGIDWKDIFLPTVQVAQSPVFEAIKGTGQVLLGEEEQKAEGKKQLVRSLTTFVPGGVSIKRGLEGFQASSRGYSESATGRVRFPVGQGKGDQLKNLLFGQWSSPQSRDYVEGGFKPLGEKQSEKFKAYEDEKAPAYYDYVSRQRDQNRVETVIKEGLESGKTDFTDVEPLVAGEAIWSYLMSLDKDKRQAAYDKLDLPADVKKGVQEVQRLSELGLSSKDRELVDAPVEIRSRLVVDRLLDLKAENRQKVYDRLRRFGIVTEAMRNEINKLLQETK